MSNLIINSIVFYVISIIIINAFDPVVFKEEYCDNHEDEILKMEKECYPLLQIELKNIKDQCLLEIRNKRAPYKRIDGKYRQFIMCDTALINEYLACEKAKDDKLLVSYNIAQNLAEFQECLYTEILVAKKLRERNKKKGAANRVQTKAPKSKKNKGK